MHIVFHAGFHKTGTKTLQNALRSNRAALAPGIRVVLPQDLKDLSTVTTLYSIKRNPLDLALVAYEAAALAERLANHAGTVLISSENMAGQIPGRQRLTGYQSGPVLLRAIADAFTEALPDARLTFFFTTRSAGPWLKSCHAQNLRAGRMTLAQAEYANAFRASAELDAVVDAIAAALPEHSVARTRIEDCGTRRLGALDVMLDLAGIAQACRAGLVTVPNANVAPSAETLAQMRTINLSPLSDADATAARKALRRGSR